MKNNILAIVVTYNRKVILKEAIEALLNQSVDQDQLDILIIDNASTDGTQESLKKYIDDGSIMYENTNKNIGGAGGFSYGMRRGVEQGYEYLWLMDDDTIPEIDCLKNLIEAKNILQDRFGFLCSYAEWLDGAPCQMNIPSVEKYWGKYANYLDKKMLLVKTASFVSFFTKSDTIREVGLPVKEFFIWGDDMELSRRISKKYPSFLVWKSKVIHKMKDNKSTDIYSETGDRLKRYEILYRNRFYFGKKNGIKELLFYFDYVLESAVRIIKKAPNQKVKRLGLLFRGFCKGIFFNPSIEFPERGTEDKEKLIN